MLPQSLEEALAVAKEPYRVVQQSINGFDVRDIQRRASSANISALNLCSAAWSVVFTRHTCQKSLDFLAMDGVQQKPLDECDFGHLTRVTATVDEDKSFHHLLHHGLGYTPCSRVAPALTSSFVALCPSSSSTRTVDLALLPDIESDITVLLHSQQAKTTQATCWHRSSMPSHFVERVIDHVLHLLRHVINQTTWNLLAVRDISMMSFEEEMQLRREAQPGLSLAEMELGSVHQLFRRQAQKTPSSPALEGPSSNILSYHEVDLMSDLMAADFYQKLLGVHTQLLSTGLAADESVVVGVMLQRSPAAVIAILSCWKAGLAVVLIDSSQPATRNNHIIEDCHCALLVVDETFTSDSWEKIAWKYDFDLLRDRAKRGGFPSNSCRTLRVNLMEDFLRPAWIRVTSGSTGRPKCALLRHSAFGSSIASYSGRIRASKTLLFFNPISSASGNAIWTFLTNGGCVCVPSYDEITSDLTGCINRYGVDDICITPSALTLTSPHQVPTLRTVSLVGEAIPRLVWEEWSPHVSLLVGYGATEMNSHALPFHDEPQGTQPPAHPLPTSDYSLYILRPGTVDICPYYTPGEICLSSTYMSTGYINNPKATSKVFLPHPFPGDAGHTYIYRTGDLGMLIGSRHFVVLGRVDFQFKIDGNRVQPEEIESIINKTPHVVKCRIILVTPSVGRPLLTCCVILKATQTSSPQADNSWQRFVSLAEEACRNHLPAYMVPHRWLQFNEFPETASAKTDTGALAKEAKKIIDSEDLPVVNGYDKNHQRDISGKERLFLNLAIEAVAGKSLDELPPESRERMQSRSFIANGGTSLSSQQLRSRLRKHGIEIATSLLYSSRTLADIASAAEEQRQADGEAAEIARPAQTVRDSLHARMPGLADYESVFPATMLQREMLTLSMLNPKLWTLIQAMDLSQTVCTLSQLREAIGLIVSAKPNLRTVISLLDVQKNPTAIETPDSVFDLIREGEFVQAVLKPGAFYAEFWQEDDIEEPGEFWRKNITKTWGFEQPLWRVAFLTKPRLLVWSFNHAIIDEWVSQNVSQDLHAVLTAITHRDDRKEGWQVTLAEACEKAARPSIEWWILATYGTSGHLGSLDSTIRSHRKRWDDFMADAVPTPIPSDLKMSPQDLPAPPLMRRIESIPYGEWCRRHHVTAASLFHAVCSLTIARLCNWWRSGGLEEPTGGITYYRLSGNRDTVQDATDLEGSLISISPMRVSVSADDHVSTISRSALENWLAMHESDPYYLDGVLIHDGPEPTARQRRWGNVLLNHIAPQPKGERPAAVGFRGVVEDKCGYAMVWPFAVLELAVIETDPVQATSLQFCVLSVLQEQSTMHFLDVFVRILQQVIETDDGVSAKEIVQQV
ncbi:hypothetical protein IL306_013150 [Fusarium sp. DS 682]|nr:hypothetical protein IL306_013150 [Fusarium sp. DS 682]